MMVFPATVFADNAGTVTYNGTDLDAAFKSIDVSGLQPGDEQLHDIFERADHMMYDRKKQLKSMGAKTRE